MKKYFLFATALAVGLAFAACGDSEEQEEEATEDYYSEEAAEYVDTLVYVPVEEESAYTPDIVFPSYNGSSSADQQSGESRPSVPKKTKAEKAREDSLLNNHLSTGGMPYYDYYGKRCEGRNSIIVNTPSGKSDYIMIFKDDNDKVVNHAYIRGGDSYTFYFPDGSYKLAIYSGRGWDSEKNNVNVIGGFYSGESVTQFVANGTKWIKLYGNECEITLRSMRNGNAEQKSTSKKEAF